MSSPGFVLQALRTESVNQGRPPRFGFTVTKKIGNAVVRNRIRRRLKEAVRLSAEGQAERDTDYVLIGRRAALTLPFDRLTTDLVASFAALARDAQVESGAR